MPLGNVLIVEDDEAWCGIYRRNVRPAHKGQVRVARTLQDALAALREMAFAVAFVDIRLDEHDDENVEGLQVLEAIKRAGDATSTIMLTGHGTVGITRDAIMRHGAYDAHEKDRVDLSEIDVLVERGTEQRNNVARVEAARAASVLRGRHPANEWDSEMLHVTGGKGGIPALYDFLEGLVGPFLPLVATSEDARLAVNGTPHVAYSGYWSRAIGGAVMVAFGREQEIEQALAGGALRGLAGSAVGEVLRQRAKSGMAGAVLALPERNRGDFA